MARYLQISAALILLSVTYLSDVAKGLSTGAPAPACSTLAPLQTGHLNAPPQTSDVPYEVDLSDLDDGTGNYTYIPGATYSLTVRSTDGNTFRGVLLQGRVMADDTPAGSFQAFDPNLRLSDCTPSDISVTHRSAIDKMSVTTLWTAPSDGTGTVQIGFAVVRERVIYWADQRTSPITEGELTCAPGSMTCPGYPRECFPFFLGAVCPPPVIGNCTCREGIAGAMCCPPYEGCFPGGFQGATCPPPPQVGNCTCPPDIVGQMCCPPFEGCFRGGFFGAVCPPAPGDLDTTAMESTMATASQERILGSTVFCIVSAVILMLLV